MHTEKVVIIRCIPT